MRMSSKRQLTVSAPTQELGVSVYPRADAEPSRYTLRVQASAVTGTVTLTVVEIVDGVPLTHVYALLPGPVRTFRYACTGLSVIASVVSVTAPPAATLDATLSDVDLGTGADAFNVEQCVPVAGAQRGLLYTGPGALLMLQALLTLTPALNATPVYAQLFDATAAPAGGESPLAFGVSAGLVSPGQAADLADELAPGTIAFASGLYVALSTTVDTYTDAGATYALRADGKVGV